MIKDKKKIFAGMAGMLAVVFAATYFLSDKYFKNKADNFINQSVETPSDNKTAENLVNENELKDETKICLYTGDIKEDELSLKELKDQLGLEKNISEDELSETLKEQGYFLAVTGEDELTYKRDPSQSVKPDKYYIGEKDGYFAIYKTDEKGNLIIENSEDVYEDCRKVSTLNEEEASNIKNLKLEYDTKDEAEEDLSEYLS